VALSGSMNLSVDMSGVSEDSGETTNTAPPPTVPAPAADRTRPADPKRGSIIPQDPNTMVESQTDEQ
jgi:hypothetical protein